MATHVLWEHEIAGSSPASPTSPGRPGSAMLVAGQPALVPDGRSGEPENLKPLFVDHVDRDPLCLNSIDVRRVAGVVAERYQLTTPA